MPGLPYPALRTVNAESRGRQAVRLRRKALWTSGFRGSKIVTRGLAQTVRFWCLRQPATRDTMT